MSTVHQRMQHVLRMYKEKTGKKEIDMKSVVKWAVSQGWPLPKPIDPLDRLTQEFSAAAREEIRQDTETGHPYRVNHAVKSTRRGEQITFWVDIDEAPRKHMRKSLIQRREQMIGDGLQLSLDTDHWNRIHPEEKPIQIPLDLYDDVEWRKASLGAKKKAS